ncbi:hypothetical protein ACLOJK_007797 [Asimina triloba]
MDSDTPIADRMTTVNRAKWAATEGVVGSVSLSNPARSHLAFNRSGSNNTFGPCSSDIPLFIVDESSVQHMTDDPFVPATSNLVHSFGYNPS